MNLIVAVTENWGIGFKGKLLMSIPEDMKFFRKTTTGKTVIMGRTTLDSFPGGKPLKNRVNITLSDDPTFSRDGVTVVHNISEAFEELKKHESDDIFVIGGASIYEQFLPYCHRAYITKMEVNLEADKFFPNLDELPAWHIASQSEHFEHEGIGYSFLCYENNAVKAL